MVELCKKKPANALLKKTSKIHKCQLKRCTCGRGRLFLDSSQAKVSILVIGGEQLRQTQSIRVQCAARSCRRVFRNNFYWEKGVKYNCLTFAQMLEQGLYFVSNDFAFSMDYLKMAYFTLLRGKLAPGQESDALRLFHARSDDLPDKVTLRDYLLHALEGYAIAQRTPDKVHV